jgi:hypothetical protein
MVKQNGKAKWQNKMVKQNGETKWQNKMAKQNGEIEFYIAEMEWQNIYFAEILPK